MNTGTLSLDAEALYAQLSRGLAPLMQPNTRLVGIASGGVWLAERLHAAPVQHIGKLLVLWRPVPAKEKLEKEDRKPGPKVVKVVSFSKSGNHRATIKKVRVLGNQRLTAAGTLKRKASRQTSAKKKSQT